MVEIADSYMEILLGAMVFGALVSLAAGLVENGLSIGTSEIKNYGYPLVWRIIYLDGSAEHVSTSLAVNSAFWIGAAYVTFVIGEIVLDRSWKRVNRQVLFLSLVLFIPLGLLMDSGHEFGHVVWGMAVGG